MTRLRAAFMGSPDFAVPSLHAVHRRCDLEGNPLEIVHMDLAPHNVLITDQGNTPDLIQYSQGWIYLYYSGSNMGPVADGIGVALMRRGAA